MKISLFLILVAISINVNAQTKFFEGKVVFKIQYFDTLGNDIAPESLGQDTEMHYFISNGNYKSLNEKGIIKQLFNGADNKYYFNNQGKIQVLDATLKYPENGLVYKLDEKKTILGKGCNSLSIKTESDSTIHYYSNELIVDKSQFQNHNFGNWNLLLNSTNGGFTLEYETYYTDMLVKMTAKEIIEMDLTEEDFKIESYLK